MIFRSMGVSRRVLGVAVAPLPPNNFSTIGKTNYKPTSMMMTPEYPGDLTRPRQEISDKDIM